MPNNNPAILKNTGINLDVAVFLAQAAQAAYLEDNNLLEIWAKNNGFPTVKFFNRDNVQGFWCTVDDIALLVFRGTSNPGQWLRDARFFPAPHPWGRVHVGFRNGVEAVESDLKEFDAITKVAKHIWICGHSLGGALAVIAAARLKMRGIESSLYTYGQPRVGLGEFAERFNVELPQRLVRFVNQSDIVTRVPPGPFYHHTGIVKRIVRPGLLESIKVLETAPIPPDLAERMESLRKVVASGSALETAHVVQDAQLGHPLFLDVDAEPLTELEFSELQFGLGATSKSDFDVPLSPQLEDAALEGALPIFSDHAINEYIRLLDEIRDQAG